MENTKVLPVGGLARAITAGSPYARGSQHYASAFRAADLRKGKPVELSAEPDNAHDRNAVAMQAPGPRKRFAYVQRGRLRRSREGSSPGEALVGVTMRGPGRGRDDDTAIVLIGGRDDIAAMLEG